MEREEEVEPAQINHSESCVGKYRNEVERLPENAFFDCSLQVSIGHKDKDSYYEGKQSPDATALTIVDGSVVDDVEAVDASDADAVEVREEAADEIVDDHRELPLEQAKHEPDNAQPDTTESPSGMHWADTLIGCAL